jgi:hypothetical protein
MLVVSSVSPPVRSVYYIVALFATLKLKNRSKKYDCNKNVAINANMNYNVIVCLGGVVDVI